MHVAIQPMPKTDTRSITAVDVTEWFGRNPPCEAACAEIAESLTKMRWPGDAPVPAAEDGLLPRLATLAEGKAKGVDLPSRVITVKQVPDPDADWWDFKAVGEAAKTLLASFPRIT
jgi:hypothetical protein